MSGSGEEDTGSEEDSFELQLELDMPSVDPPTDLSDPMTRLTNAALEDMLTGEEGLGRRGYHYFDGEMLHRFTADHCGHHTGHA